MNPPWPEERFDDYGILRFSRDGRPLEHAIRDPIRNANWHLIRRLKIVGIMSDAKNMTDSADSASQLDISKEMDRLTITEERDTLRMYVEEIKSTRNWFGMSYHFRNLVVTDASMQHGSVEAIDTPLKWLEKLEKPVGTSDGQSPTTSATRPHQDPASSPSTAPSVIGNDSPTEASANSTRPVSDEQDTNESLDSDQFRPSFSLQNNKPPTDPVIAQLALEKGIKIGPNYEGQLTLASIRDRTCPADQNCSVYMRNLNPAWTTAEILDCIHEGGIYKFSRQRPNANYELGAVSITFKHRQATANFLQRAKTVGVFINGHQLNIIPSRHHSWGIEEHREKQSRVLQIEGTEEVWDPDEVEAELHKNISFQLVKREEWVEADGRKFVNFHFESIFGQSRAAVAFLAKTEKYSKNLSWRYAKDPCAVYGG